MQKEVLFQQEETDVSSPESNHQHGPDDAENIPEQKDYSPVAEVLAESYVVTETWWSSTLDYFRSLDERHGASHKVWSTLNQLSRKAMENTYVAGTVNRLSEGAGLARVIYAQTRELIEEKRREHRTTTTNDPDHSSVTVVIHNNDNFLRGEAEGTSSSEPMPSTAAVHVNPEH